MCGHHGGWQGQGLLLARGGEPSDCSRRHWVDALTLVSRLKDGSQDLTDPEEIKKHSLFANGK